jgi:sterol desaturase/sphingolipid hydroxylase (fatty acid hydroxylase superfamily)
MGAIIKNKGQGTLFRNKYLELLTKSTPIIILSIYIPIIAIFITYTFYHFKFSFLVLTGLFFAGIFSWTFFEYILHRYIFHFITDNKHLQKVVYTIHGVHHEYPRDDERLLMPPIPNIITATLFFLFFKIISGSYVFIFFPGFVTGYLIYGMIHYSIHAIHPPFKFLKPLWTYHHVHHYKSPNKAFGVSSPLWDYIFGTTPDKRS